MDSEDKLDGVSYAAQEKWVSRKLAYKSEDLVGVDRENKSLNLGLVQPFGRVKAGIHVFPGFFQSLPVFKQKNK